MNSSTHQTGAGQAYVGANEEVLCWDLKKGDLLSKWRAHDCKAEVAVIAKSKADRDIFAVGYESNGSNFGGENANEVAGTKMEAFEFGTRERTPLS